MTFLPIVDRELRVASRRRGTYWSRFAAALVGLALGGWIMMLDYNTPRELGALLFATLSGVMFLYVLFVGAQVTCDCLSEEKRDGTLGLLFLTDLKGYDIVLGKLAATSMTVFYGVLAVVPVLAIPLLLGGVAYGEFWRVVLVTMNLLFFSLTAGIVASAACRGGIQAACVAVGLILLFVGGGPLVGALCSIRSSAFSLPELLTTSPVCDCFIAFELPYRSDVTMFWTNVAWTQFFSWTFLLVACRLVPLSWQDRSSGPKLGFAQRWRAWLEGAPESRHLARRGMLETNPYSWRAGRHRGKTILVWGFLLIVAVIWLWARHIVADGDLDDLLNVSAVLIVHFVLKFWVASEACRHFSEDRRAGAMELLLSTPLSVKEIISGQRIALFRQFGGPVAAVLAVDLTFLFVALQRAHERDATQEALIFYLIMGGFFVMDLVVLSWVGLWRGLRGRSPNRAANLALAQILGLPSVVCCILAGLWALISAESLTGANFATTWVILGVAANLFFMITAKRRLHGEFREIVTQKRK